MEGNTHLSVFFILTKRKVLPKFHPFSHQCLLFFFSVSEPNLEYCIVFRLFEL